MKVEQVSHVAIGYHEAPLRAMDMVKVLDKTVFFDTFTQGGKKKHALNFKGIKVLAGLMRCTVTRIEVVADNDDFIEVECEAECPSTGARGFSRIAQAKYITRSGKKVYDDKLYQKAYTFAKRNALRDLVPDQVFCELLVKAQMSNKQNQNTVINTAIKQQEQRPVEAPRDAIEDEKSKLREMAKAKKSDLMEEFGLSIQDCVDHVEVCLDKSQDDWDIKGWRMLAEVLKDPVGMGVDQAVEIDTANKMKGEEDAPEEEEVPEEELDDQETEEVPSDKDSDLENLISSL